MILNLGLFEVFEHLLCLIFLGDAVARSEAFDWSKLSLLSISYPTTGSQDNPDFGVKSMTRTLYWYNMPSYVMASNTVPLNESPSKLPQSLNFSCGFNGGQMLNQPWLNASICETICAFGGAFMTRWCIVNDDVSSSNGEDTIEHQCIMWRQRQQVLYKWVPV